MLSIVAARKRPVLYTGTITDTAGAGVVGEAGEAVGWKDVEDISFGLGSDYSCFSRRPPSPGIPGEGGGEGDFDHQVLG
jgi:hypothetical protein